jgi:endoglucanase
MVAMPLSASGRFVVDAHGKRLRLAGVNWYRASEDLRMAAGLDCTPRSELAKLIAGLDSTARGCRSAYG